MAYKGFVSEGEDMVGELKALRHRLLAQNRQKISHSYDSEEELIAESDYIDRLKYNEDRVGSRRMAYCLYWAAEKGQEREHHSAKLCWAPCPGCGLCECGTVFLGQRFICLCSEGKKMLSPFRILFLSTGIRENWRTTIYEIGQGYTPRTEFKTQPPTWQEISW